MAQRLVRSICPHCKSRAVYDKRQLQTWGIQEFMGEGPFELWKGKGCEFCRYTGYMERTGIFEILPFDTEFKEALRKGEELAAVRSLVRRKGVPSLFQDGVAKAKQGITTLEEVIRVTGGAVE
jgi:general secretion pathway protein E